ncbi:glycoside hydrolase family 31 protein [Apiospora phragmitis]|uniref:alpha-glucosidase n=1 Tax=Apiospora phragmitis TaxID=2905665 RepID=A0ABR1SVI0_9PEZI
MARHDDPDYDNQPKSRDPFTFQPAMTSFRMWPAGRLLPIIPIMSSIMPKIRRAKTGSQTPSPTTAEGLKWRVELKPIGDQFYLLQSIRTEPDGSETIVVQLWIQRNPFKITAIRSIASTGTVNSRPTLQHPALDSPESIPAAEGRVNAIIWETKSRALLYQEDATILNVDKPLTAKYLGITKDAMAMIPRKWSSTIPPSTRTGGFPLNGMHIDVDMQRNYKTFTIDTRPGHFPDPKAMFNRLRAQGVKCSTNITPVISIKEEEDFVYETYNSAWRGSGKTGDSYHDNYFVRDVRDNDPSVDPVNEELYLEFGKGTRYLQNPNTDRPEYGDNYDFAANRNSGWPFHGGVDYGGTKGSPGFYPNLNDREVRKWWGQQYQYLFDQGLEFVWQDTTSPCMAQQYGDMKSWPFRLLLDSDGWPNDPIAKDKRKGKKWFQEPFEYENYRIENDYKIPNDQKTVYRAVLPVTKYLVRLRYSLIQLLYNAMFENAIRGLPIARSIVISDPLDPSLFASNEWYTGHQYTVGKDLLDVPVMQRQSEKGSVTSVYLPYPDAWYTMNLRPDTDPNAPGAPLEPKVRGGAYIDYNEAQLPYVTPMYIHEGAIIPQQEVRQSVPDRTRTDIPGLAEEPAIPVTIHIYPGKDNNYSMYIDDDVSRQSAPANDWLAMQQANITEAVSRKLVNAYGDPKAQSQFREVQIAQTSKWQIDAQAGVSTWRDVRTIRVDTPVGSGFSDDEGRRTVGDEYRLAIWHAKDVDLDSIDIRAEQCSASYVPWTNRDLRVTLVRIPIEEWRKAEVVITTTV